MGKRRFAVLCGGGSFNPLTRMHLRTYFLAKQCLEARYGYVVLGTSALFFYFIVFCSYANRCLICLVFSPIFTHSLTHLFFSFLHFLPPSLLHFLSPSLPLSFHPFLPASLLGSLLSPAHGATVRERYRTNPSEIIPSPHRLAVAQLLVQNSKLLSIDPWEITRRRAMDYLSLLEHTQQIITEQFPDTEIKVYILLSN
jgi:hypothetical protein